MIVWIVEHRQIYHCFYSHSDEGIKKEDTDLVGVFSKKESAIEWIVNNASTYDKIDKITNRWYWFALYAEILDYPIFDSQNSIEYNDETKEQMNDLLFYNYKGFQIETQPTNGYSDEEGNCWIGENYQ